MIIVWSLGGLFLFLCLWVYVRQSKANQPPPEPASNELLCKKFDSIRLKSQCTYAHNAKAFGGPNWNDNLTLEENLTMMVSALSHFVKIAKKERIDGFIIEITDPCYGKNDEVVSNTVLRVVKYFVELQVKSGSNGKSTASWKSYIDKKIQKQQKWCDYGITINNERLFITPFAPCYPETSSRYAFGEKKSTYLLLQASWSFDLLTQKAGGDWNKILELRDKIRENFAKHGRPYAEYAPKDSRKQ